MKLIKISAMWCSSCLIMEKIWRELQAKKSNIEFISYDYDFDDESQEYNPGDILPVIILMDNDKELTRFTGEKTIEELLEGISKYEK